MGILNFIIQFSRMVPPRKSSAGTPRKSPAGSPRKSSAGSRLSRRDQGRLGERERSRSTARSSKRDGNTRVTADSPPSTERKRGWRSERYCDKNDCFYSILCFIK